MHDFNKIKESSKLNEPPQGSPNIVSPKINFKGSIYHFALAKHNQYAENKNRPEYSWATTRTIFFSWLKFQWTINSKDFTVQELKTSLSIGVEKGFLDPNDIKDIPE